MLYLEARCLAVVRAAGSQGVQNGSISCVALVLSVPGGTRAILGENVLAAWLDLEVASGNDAIASHSEIRKTAKLMGQFLPGTDFVTSGYSVMPRHDNTFGGGNFDADDIDEWLTIQRDWQVDAGIEPVSEDEVSACASVRPGRCKPCSPSSGSRRWDDEVAAATSGYDSREMPDRDRAADVEAADDLLARGVSGLDVALALDRLGFEDVAEAVLAMQRQRVSADYLQTSAVIDARTVSCTRRSTTRTSTRGRERVSASRAIAGSSCSRCRTSSHPPSCWVTRLRGRRSSSSEAAAAKGTRGRGRRRSRPCVR